MRVLSRPILHKTSAVPSLFTKIDWLYRIYDFLRTARRNLSKVVFLFGHLCQVVWIGAQAGLRRIDSVVIPKSTDEIRMFLVIRNERTRLPYLLEYYRRKGVARFFVVDNDSSDDSVAFLLSQPDVHIFSTKQSYRQARFGQVWMNILLYKYGIGHWCVVGDADELLVYPYSETLSLKDLARYMDARKQTVLNAVVLDMYTDKPLELAEYLQGEDPFTSAPYFDATGYSRSLYPETRYSGRLFCTGGVRRRVFGVDACLNKAPFIKFSYKTIYEHSCHHVRNANPADFTAATLHFKFFSNFIPRTIEETQRQQHWKGGVEYKAYAVFLNTNKEVNLYCPQSCKFQDSQQLIRLGLMKTSLAFEEYTRQSLDLPPASYHFLMNDYCNCDCVFCNQTFLEDSRKDITLEKFKAMIAHVPVKQARNFHFTGGGEPLLSKDLFAIIEYINKNYPFINVSIRTNGVLIKKHAEALAALNISALEVSVHGLAKENDAIMQRPGATDTIFEGIVLLNALLEKKNKKIIKTFCCVVSKTNIDALPKLIQKAAELKVEQVTTEFCRYFPHRTGAKLSEKDSLFFYQDLYNRVVVRSRFLAKRVGVHFAHDPLFGQPSKKFSCTMPWAVMLVGPEGDVFPCCGGEVWFNDQVKSGRYYFGNLLKEPLLSFWNKPTYARLRKPLTKAGGEPLVPECRACHRLTYTMGPNIKEAHILCSKN